MMYGVHSLYASMCMDEGENTVHGGKRKKCSDKKEIDGYKEIG